MLAVAAGSTFGLTAALMKAMTRTWAEGLGQLLAEDAEADSERSREEPATVR